MNTLHYLAFTGCLLLIGCSAINQRLGWENDNLAEQICEDVVESAIQAKTGYRPELDFTP